MNVKARVIAFYLPQFHPIPDNDKWWGKGFTEWTNVGKAKPLFKGHYQPRIPADLGYYDLRVPETREAQADMAREYGIEGFCYWHYWFGNGKCLLERPFNEVLLSGDPDFPFCLAWANETWKGFAHGLKNRNTLIEQLYPGVEDYTNHFYTVLSALKDKRYITVEGKPLFLIYKPLANPEVSVFIKTWRELAIKNGLKGIYFVGQTDIGNEKNALNIGIDAVNTNRMMTCVSKRTFFQKVIQRLKINILNRPRIFDYAKASKWFIDSQDREESRIPTIYSGWDHTPRSGREGTVFTNYTPSNFENHVSEVLENVKDKSEQHKIILLKSWNEWGEGNYLEPDYKYGKQFLNALKTQLFNY